MIIQRLSRLVVSGRHLVVWHRFLFHKPLTNTDVRIKDSRAMLLVVGL